MKFSEKSGKENQQILKFHCDTISQIFQEKFNLKNSILLGEFNDKFKDIYGILLNVLVQVSIKKKDGYDVISAKKQSNNKDFLLVFSCTKATPLIN